VTLPRDIFRGLYNAGMTSQPKKRRRTERRLTDHFLTQHRLTEQRLTEQRNAASKNLDRMTAVEIVRLMNREDRKVAVAVGREIPAIARAVDVIVRRMQNGGRLIYVGAGSSGRMAVLDAAECPPTFGISKKTDAGVDCGWKASGLPGRWKGRRIPFETRSAIWAKRN